MIKQIYLAGGCFWGVEAYFSRLYGVLRTQVGYANGKTKNPTYEEVCLGNTCFAETVMVEYNDDIISLGNLLFHYFDIINPTTLNKQGNDVGTQYRSGIYYTDDKDKNTIDKVMSIEAKKYDKPIVVEIEKLKNFYPAEEYHQKYLEKNPQGYCHINLEKYKRPTESELRKILSETEYNVTQKNETEAAYTSKYDKNYADGIYVDIVTGEPLFSSKDKYEAGCGWPAFTKPIKNKMVKEKIDTSFGMNRTEVRSAFGDSHLGHVFDDGPKDKGGKRYCINGAALRFIPKDDLKKEGYGEFEKEFNY